MTYAHGATATGLAARDALADTLDGEHDEVEHAAEHELEDAGLGGGGGGSGVLHGGAHEARSVPRESAAEMAE